MLINPVTIRMNQHELDEIYNAARKQLAKLTPGSMKYKALEMAVYALADALHYEEKQS